MIVKVPEQRKHKSNGKNPFGDLVSYIEGEKEKSKLQTDKKQTEQVLDNQFGELLTYATNQIDQNTNEEKCIAIRTHGVVGITTAAMEMNQVAAMNSACQDPAYHFIISWPEHEKPDVSAVFDAAEHALEALGLLQHQYVLAIHDNTDNFHCHISVNRVHPQTYKSRNLTFPLRALHKAARESEIKHNWTHTNGIYIVEVDGHGKKHVVPNPDMKSAFEKQVGYAKEELAQDLILPAWHDPDSLESWLKTKLNKQLNRDIKKLNGWPALHSWLDKHNITLKDTGGGGMRLEAVSHNTGEIVNIAASKGLRAINRPALEKEWGKFNNAFVIPCIVPDLTHLNPKQIQKGIDRVLRKPNYPTPPGSRDPRPPDHIIRDYQLAERNEAQRGGGMHELSDGGVDGRQQDPQVPLQDALQGGVGDTRSGKDTGLRRTGATETGGRSQRSLNRDDSIRAERKAQRALARADLRQRYSKYKQFTRVGDTDHFLRVKELRQNRSHLLKRLADEKKKMIAEIPKSASKEDRLISLAAINNEILRGKLIAEAQLQRDLKDQQATRMPALSWRTWLYEQSNLGDKAAISALRGIVYQEGRDAKQSKVAKDDTQEDNERDEADPDEQYKKLIARLQTEELREAAIRSVNMATMRPYQADVLLAMYEGINWRVTGNGNIEYAADTGSHLFTDRGNRVTFDREKVTDDEIMLALKHAQQKFGHKLTLTGEDRVFTERMARLADDLGITVLNPDLQPVIEAHRKTREEALQDKIELQITQALEDQNVVDDEPVRHPIDAKAPALKRHDDEDKTIPPTPEKTVNISVSHAVELPVESSDEPQPQPMAVEVPDDRHAPVDHEEPEQADQPELVLQPAVDFDWHARLSALVLDIDPKARFVVPGMADGTRNYAGRVIASGDGETPCFAQHIGQGVYALHKLALPTFDQDATITVEYKAGHEARIGVRETKGKAQGI